MGFNDHLLAVGVIFGSFDAFGIGANDVANSFSTAVNSGVFTMLQAAIVATCMEFLGAVLVGKSTAGTIAKNILTASKFTAKAGLLQLGMVCALIASSTFLQLANMTGMPVSTTHSIVGGILGVGVAAFGPSAINWWGFETTTCGTSSNPTGYIAGICSSDIGFGPIAISWVVSPIVSGIFAAVIFGFTKYIIMKSKNSFWRAVYFAPFFYAFVGGILTVFIVYKGSGRAGLDSKESSDIALASCLVALACGLVAGLYVSWWKVRVDWHGEDIKTYEYPYFFMLPKRPVRPGFHTTHLNAAAESAASTPTNALKTIAPAPADAESQPASFGKESYEETLAIHKVDNMEVFITDVDARATGAIKAPKTAKEFLAALTIVQSANMTAEARGTKVVPPVIKAAMEQAEQHGYVVREMGENEKVCLEYKKVCVQGTWMDRLLCPIKTFLCHGVFGTDGEERSVRTHGLEEVEHIHGSVEKFDEKTEDFFRWLQAITSSLASFSHGSNDVANAIGPFAVIYGVWSTGQYKSKYDVYDWMLAWGGGMISLGFLVYGYHLMRSLGNYITYHSPSRGYSMELGAAICVLFASKLGIPVSTTQCITGATIAVGMMSGTKSVNWPRVLQIFGSWLITVPVVAIWAGLLFGFCAYSPTMRSPQA